MSMELTVPFFPSSNGNFFTLLCHIKHLLPKSSLQINSFTSQTYATATTRLSETQQIGSEVQKVTAFSLPNKTKQREHLTKSKVTAIPFTPDGFRVLSESMRAGLSLLHQTNSLPLASAQHRACENNSLEQDSSCPPGSGSCITCLIQSQTFAADFVKNDPSLTNYSFG